MESFDPNRISHNLHWNGVGEDWQRTGSGTKDIEDTADGYHIFGLEWSRDGYKFYVDGKLDWEIDGPVSDREQFILVSTECMGYRNEPARPDPNLKNVIGDSFVVDYIRVFDECK